MAGESDPAARGDFRDSDHAICETQVVSDFLSLYRAPVPLQHLCLFAIFATAVRSTQRGWPIDTFCQDGTGAAAR